ITPEEYGYPYDVGIGAVSNLRSMRARLFAPENRKWWTLAAVTFGLFMIMLDNTVVNVALPSMQDDLGISQAGLEWVVNAYALTFGVLLLSGGKLADLFGRRTIFIVGLVIFTASSLACGLATGSEILIAARTVQGIGAALMNPATLSIITATFPPRQRGMAIGIWAGVSAMALAIGPLVGGILTEKINWSWIFFINVPIGVLGIAAARIFVDESRDTSHEQRLDLPGRLSDRIGPRWLMGGGMVLLTASLLVFSTLDVGSSFWNILPGLLVGGFGMALVMTPTTAAAMGSVPVAKAGVGSAVINSMRQVGGSLGIAVMGAVVATQVTARVPGPQFAEQFTRGYHDALYVGAGITLGAAIVAASLVRTVTHPHPT